MSRNKTLPGPYQVIIAGLTLEVTNVELDPPDPSVGIMGWQIAGYEATDLMGNEVDVEAEEMCEKLWEKIGDFE